MGEIEEQSCSREEVHLNQAALVSPFITIFVEEFPYGLHAVREGGSEGELLRVNKKTCGFCGLGWVEKL